MSRFALEVLLHWASVGLYLAATAVLAHATFFDRPERSRWGLRLAAAGLLPQGIAIVVRWVAVGHGPYLLKYEVLSSDAWLAVAAFLVAVAFARRWSVLGLVVLPVAALMIAGGLFSNPSIRELPPTFRSIWLVFHITLAKLAAGAFILSLATAILLLFDLGKGSAWRAKLPAPEALDGYTVRFIGFGFMFWTCAVAAGSIWAHQSWGRYWGWDPIETWSLVTWLVYGSYLHARLFFKVKPRTSAWMVLGAFAIFILTLLILPLLVPSLHSAYFQ